MRKYLFLIILSLGFVVGINCYFRAFPAYFPQLQTQAKAIVNNRIYQSAINEVSIKHPNFSGYAKERLANELFKSITKFSREKIKQQEKIEYLKLKSPFQNFNGQTYLMELDCWNWARYTENVYLSGRAGYQTKDGREWDMLMFAPKGGYMGRSNLLFYLSAFLYKLYIIFYPLPINTFLFYLPLFYAAIFISAMYFICLYFFGNIAAIISCLFIGLAPMFIPRSCVGWFDMDIFSLFYPFLIIWAYLCAYSSITLKRTVLWVVLASFLTCLFCFTWPDWWFIIAIIMIYELLTLANLSFDYWQFKKDCFGLFKRHIFVPILFLLIVILGVFIVTKHEPFSIIYEQTENAIKLNNSLKDSIWPNVFYTVSELSKSSFNQISAFTWGKIIFFVSLISMLALFLRFRVKKDYDFKHDFILVMVIWFFAMLFACSKGVRFIIFLLVPLGISLGWFAEIILANTRDLKKKAVIIALILLMIFVLMEKAFLTSINIYPLINNTWYNLMLTLKINTPAHAIINSWWDFGDWFKSIARRGVIFDGQSQNTPQAYWMAKTLLSDDEEYIMNILRMLNNSGNDAFETIDNYLNNSFASITILDRVLHNPDKADEIMGRFLPQRISQKVEKMIFAKPKEAYYVIDPYMLDKIYAISFLGNWDTLKVYISKNINKLTKEKLLSSLEKLGYDTEKSKALCEQASLIPAASLEGWISHRLRFYGRYVIGTEKNGIIYFDNGLVYNPKNKTALLFYGVGDNAFRVPRSLFIYEEGKSQEIIYEDANLEFSILIIKTKDGTYKSIALDRELGTSMFVRLFFLEGEGSKHFKPFVRTRDGNLYISVFRIDWN